MDRAARPHGLRTCAAQIACLCRWADRLAWSRRVQQASNNKAFTAHLLMHRQNSSPLKHWHHPDRTQILQNSIIRLGDEIKIAHFLSPHKEQINFPRAGRGIFLPLGFLASGAAAWLAASGGPGPGCTPRRRTVTSAAASLFAPRYENCHHLASPSTSQNEKK